VYRPVTGWLFSFKKLPSVPALLLVLAFGLARLVSAAAWLAAWPTALMSLQKVLL